MKESLIEKTVCDKATSLGWYSFKLTSPSTKGLPDRVFMRNGCLFFIEFKTKGKNLTKLQKWVRAKILQHRFHVYRIDSIEDGYNLLESFDK